MECPICGEELNHHDSFGYFAGYGSGKKCGDIYKCFSEEGKVMGLLNVSKSIMCKLGMHKFVYSEENMLGKYKELSLPFIRRIRTCSVCGAKELFYNNGCSSFWTRL